MKISSIASFSCSVCLLAASLVSFAPFSLQAAEASSSQIKQSYAGISSFRADFTQVLTHKESGNKETRKGVLQFRKPLLIRWETKEPHAELLTVSPTEIWNYIPEEEIAYRYPPDLVQDSRSIIQVLTGQAALDKDFDVKPAGTSGKLRKLKIYPKEPTTDMVEAMLYVDTKGFIQRVDVIDFYGNHNDVTFTSFSPDASVADKAFSFTPPKGIEVEDRREKGKIEERNLFN